MIRASLAEVAAVPVEFKHYNEFDLLDEGERLRAEGRFSRNY